MVLAVQILERYIQTRMTFTLLTAQGSKSEESFFWIVSASGANCSWFAILVCASLEQNMSSHFHTMI